MFNKSEKVILGIAGVQLVGALVIAVYSYGKAKYYEGRVDKYNELKPTLEGQQIILHDLIDRSKKEEA